MDRQTVIEEIKRNCKRALLLQGPRGLFFARFGRYLRRYGITVYKINLNGGDEVFYPAPNAYAFRGRHSEWEGFIANFLKDKGIDAVFLFGDCRPYHQMAKKQAYLNAVAVYVFEEGYIRPDYITLERHGVNGHSNIPCSPQFYLSLPKPEEHRPLPAGISFFRISASAVVYHLFELLMRWKYPHYRYHKKFSYPKEPFLWIRSGLRKILYRYKERKIGDELIKQFKKKYFLVPLQVFNDSQVILHSKYKSVDDFIAEVIKSFASSAPDGHLLIFKHHPMDRGHKNYSKVIEFFASWYGIPEQVRYVHDIHLPTLLKNALGIVLINSTVGISSLLHNTPVKAMGTAVYDMPGLTFQGSLDEFWSNPGSVDMELYRRFRWYVIKHTQSNGSFYGLWPFADKKE
jgi:capsular polysaccharide export protein